METYRDLTKNYYKVGCNFDPELINVVKELNEKYKNHGSIVELFGSDRDTEEVTARPGWRLPKISKEYFADYVKKLNDIGVKFNFTMNSIIPYGSKVEMVKHKKDIQDLVKWLESIGVYRLTIANPEILIMVREVSNIEVEMSCITHIDTVTQMKYYHETFGVNKFCCSILKNRNKEFLIRAQDYCNRNGCILEIMCQEMCGVAGIDNQGSHYATHCVFRDSCYICHACNRTKEESMLDNNYPMSYCMSARSSTPEAWLRMRWIRPEDQKIYREKTGVNYWKVSGRTGTLEYMKFVLEAYMSESYNGNLLGLWKPLSSIYDGKTELKSKTDIDIPNKKLDGFINKWMDGNGWECENHECGYSCRYCEQFAKEHNLYD
nr:MAG TPA: putative protease [Ackermannviridae sp.]